LRAALPLVTNEDRKACQNLTQKERTSSKALAFQLYWLNPLQLSQILRVLAKERASLLSWPRGVLGGMLLIKMSLSCCLGLAKIWWFFNCSWSMSC